MGVKFEYSSLLSNGQSRLIVRKPITGGANVIHIFFKLTVLSLVLSTLTTLLREGQVT